MLRELKILLHIIVIFSFIFFSIKYYFSDIHKKKSFRAIELTDTRIKIYTSKLPILENDTKNIIEYVENNKTQSKKKYNFWNLLENNEE